MKPFSETHPSLKGKVLISKEEVTQLIKELVTDIYIEGPFSNPKSAFERFVTTLNYRVHRLPEAHTLDKEVVKQRLNNWWLGNGEYDEKYWQALLKSLGLE